MIDLLLQQGYSQAALKHFMDFVFRSLVLEKFLRPQCWFSLSSAEQFLDSCSAQPNSYCYCCYLLSWFSGFYCSKYLYSQQVLLFGSFCLATRGFFERLSLKWQREENCWMFILKKRNEFLEFCITWVYKVGSKSPPLPCDFSF